MVLACTLYNFAFGLFHLGFWRLFGWPSSLAPSGRLNAAITQTLHIVLVYCFFAFAAGLSMAPDSVRVGLVVAGAGFWTLRAVLQPVMFGLRHPASVAIFAVFLAGVGLHTAAAFALRAAPT